MKLMVINILAFLLVPTAYAIDFTFNSPESVNLKESFQISLYSNAPGEYDVKIFVHNSSDSKIKQDEIISKIENEGKWQDPWKYVLSALPSRAIYTLKVEEQPGDRNICVRLRKTNQSLFDEMCKPIKVNANYEKDADDESKIINKSKDDRIIEEDVEEKTVVTPSVISEKVINTNDNVKTPDEKIILNKKKSNQVEKEYVTKQEKIRIYFIYGFSFFCLIIVILLALRKL